MASITTTFISSAFLFLFLLLNPSSSMAQSSNILYSGENLSAGNSLNDGIYTFIMQQDCNLVLQKQPSVRIWASNTGGHGSGCRCSLLKDGNLVIFKPDGAPIWASNSNRGQGNYVLILQKNGDVVIYGGAIWTPGTGSLNSKCGGAGAGAMDVVSIRNLPSPIIYTDGIDLAKNVTTGRITTRAGRVV